MRRWDELCRTRRVVAIGGLDAHQYGKRIGPFVPVRVMAYHRSLPAHPHARPLRGAAGARARARPRARLRRAARRAAATSPSTRSPRHAASASRPPTCRWAARRRPDAARSTCAPRSPARLRLLRDGARDRRGRRHDRSTPRSRSRASTARRPAAPRRAASAPGSCRTRYTCADALGLARRAAWLRCGAWTLRSWWPLSPCSPSLLVPAGRRAPRSSGSASRACRPTRASPASRRRSSRRPASGSACEHVAARRSARRADCFYVYPTVSDQQRPQATQVVDDVLRSIALHQTARYSRDCRVFAPVYRQVTIQGLLNPQHRHAGDARARRTPTWSRRGARTCGSSTTAAAWSSSSHSQGSFVLRRLIARGGRREAGGAEAPGVGAPARRERQREEGQRPRRRLQAHPRLPVAAPARLRDRVLGLQRHAAGQQPVRPDHRPRPRGAVHQPGARWAAARRSSRRSTPPSRSRRA